MTDIADRVVVWLNWLNRRLAMLADWLERKNDST